MNSKKLLHISFADDSLSKAESEMATAFDDSMVDRAVGGYFADLTIESFRICDLHPVVFPEIGDYRGIIIGGSGHFVREADNLSWMRAITEFIQHVVEAGVPLLGICFGHQLIAHALGGVVAPFYDGRRDFGVIKMGVEEHAEKHLLFDDVPVQFDALASHGDHVHTLPAGARVLAKSESCDIEAAEFTPVTYGVQFHPEYTSETMLDLARKRIVDENSRARFAAGLSDTPDAARVLKNFVKFAVDQ